MPPSDAPSHPDLPPGLVPCGSSRTFTQDDLPRKLQEAHDLRAGRWGLFQLLEGAVVFVDLEAQTERALTAPATLAIQPQALHKLRVEGPLTCRIDFFEAPGA
jgi:tellurite resistance-related uncharacterized protein